MDEILNLIESVSEDFPSYSSLHLPECWGEGVVLTILVPIIGIGLLSSLVKALTDKLLIQDLSLLCRFCMVDAIFLLWAYTSYP